MGFREAVTVCIQDYYVFSGRARRPEFWWFALFVTAVSLGLSAVDAVIFGDDMLLGLGGLFALLVACPQLAVGWRRMHDTGRSGWLYLLPLGAQVVLYLKLLFLRHRSDPVLEIYLAIVGLILTIVVLVWLALPGEVGPNRFGEEPPP
jgi:uncharacterized membrane protein YhaH (DUF805 family)